MKKEDSHTLNKSDFLFIATDDELRRTYQPGLTETAVWTRGDPIPMPILNAGSRVFNSPEAFLDWMYEPHPSIKGVRPIDRMSDSNGIAKVCHLLERVTQTD